MNANQMNTGRSYWLAWFLASAMGFGTGALMGMYFAYGLFPGDTFNTKISLIFGIVMGATGGYFQWVVLRERIAGSGLWGLTGALGFGLAIGAAGAFNPGENYAMAGLLIGSVYGAVSGILQWLILRRKVARSGWWLLANLLGSLAGAIAIPIAAAIGEAGNWDLAVMAFGLVFGAGYGVITGAALVGLLSQAKPSHVDEMAATH